ncbi:unnamed protein product [Euphydryas editha]|uniref:Uncharacterized protein n=1 Tax=Euphydryas editha TaxID=104508 RepID=A0AAU9UZI2_EUPED|nr:unnamed protein product [Euphydryas editha]
MYITGARRRWTGAGTVARASRPFAASYPPRAARVRPLPARVSTPRANHCTADRAPRTPPAIHAALDALARRPSHAFACRCTQPLESRDTERNIRFPCPYLYFPPVSQILDLIKC